MFWIVLMIVAILAGLAFNWIVVRTSNERITVSLELAKITPALRKAKAGAITIMHRAQDFRSGHGQRSGSAGRS